MSYLNNYCMICKLEGKNHKEKNCPLKCIYCDGYHTSDNHSCMICKTTGIDHKEEQCPLKCKFCTGYHTTDKHLN